MRPSLGCGGSWLGHHWLGGLIVVLELVSHLDLLVLVRSVDGVLMRSVLAFPRRV
jgi:hypothetical protein